MWLEVGRTTIVALPGVPAEMAAILEASVLPALASRAPAAVYLERAIKTQARDESQVAPVLGRIAQELPDVFLKSHATRFGADVRMEGSEAKRILDQIKDEIRTTVAARVP